MLVPRMRLVLGVLVRAVIGTLGLTSGGSGHFVAPILAAQSTAPAPAAEQKSLEFLVGKWRLEGIEHDSQFGKGGKVTGTNACEWFDGRFHLICRGEFTEPDGSKTTQLEILGYNSGEGVYERFHVDSAGGSSRATATRDGKNWLWHGTVTVDGRKTRFDVPVTQTSQDSFTVKVTATPEGAKPTLIEESTATRIR